MKNQKITFKKYYLLIVAFLFIAVACGGGGGGGGAASPPSYSIGGTATGLTGTVVLQNNNGDNLTVTADGTFTFATPLADSGTYSVTVMTQPTGQTCSVSTGAGTVSGGDVTNVAVVCAINAYSVGGGVTGLTGSVVLQNNNGDNLTVTANGPYTFATPVAFNSPYAVSVLTQPSVSQSCSVANGSGTMGAGNVSNVTITCAINTYTVGGNVSLLNGSMVLQNNAADNHTVSVNGPFNFPTAVNHGNPYNVTILTQPSLQRCNVTNGTGSVTANVSNVAISCASQMGGALQGIALNLTPTVSTLAGSAGILDGTATQARFKSPQKITSDGTNLYVADTGHHVIRQIVIATGAVTTLAGTGVAGAADGPGVTATFYSPIGITTDGTNLYVADSGNNKIRQVVIATGAVTTLAGTGGIGAVDGAGLTVARFSFPRGITTDNTNLYVADTSNNQIRQVVIATGAVTTLAGTGGIGAADGAGLTVATFNQPNGIILYGTNLYVVDTRNHKIRQIAIATGMVTSYTGVANTVGTMGATDGTLAAATFFYPSDIALIATRMYVTDSSSNRIRQVDIATGAVTTLAGTGGIGAADGVGVTATFNSPIGITTDGTDLYVADLGNSTIRKIITATGVVSTQASVAPDTDGTGPTARFRWMSSVTTDGTNLYVADSGNNKIRQVDIATGAVTTLAGTGVAGAADGAGLTAATFDNPMGITTDGTNLYVADNNNHKIRQIVIATGAVTTLAGTGALGATDGAGLTARFNSPSGITTDGTNLYVVDKMNRKIRQIVIATGIVSTLAGTGVAGAADGAGVTATFNFPYGITTDGTNLYVADSGNNKIRQVVIASGAVTTLAGTGALGAADGVGSTTATFNNPMDITTDGTNLYVADTYSGKIRQIVIATGAVTTLAGTGAFGAADGAGSVATFDLPYGITSDGTNLYVVDTGNSTIRKIQ